MTNRVDRLEERGLVQRERDVNDRRGVRVVLTDQGRDLVDRALAVWLDRERQLLSPLTDQERTELANMLRSVALAFEG